MIEVNKVKYSYNSERSFAFPDFTVDNNSPLLILGQSGVGKTTLLHLLGGLMPAGEGSIVLDGTNIANLRGKSLDKFRGDNISIIFQQNHFISALNVLENLELAMTLGGAKKDSSLINNYLNTLGLGSHAKSMTYELSQGERQRVSIIRALLNTPKLILADEPTAALDDKNAIEVGQLLKAQALQVGAALLIVTHDGRLKQIFDQTLTLQ